VTNFNVNYETYYCEYCGGLLSDSDAIIQFAEMNGKVLSKLHLIHHDCRVRDEEVPLEIINPRESNETEVLQQMFSLIKKVDEEDYLKLNFIFEMAMGYTHYSFAEKRFEFESEENIDCNEKERQDDI